MGMVVSLEAIRDGGRASIDATDREMASGGRLKGSQGRPSEKMLSC